VTRCVTLWLMHDDHQLGGMVRGLLLGLLWGLIDDVAECDAASEETGRPGQAI
jgi:hypothetical protein